MIHVTGHPVAVVTGAGSGIGAGIARLLAGGGYAVALWDLRADLAEKVLREIAGAGGQAVVVGVDVSDHDSVRTAAAQTATALGPAKALVNNAGISDVRPFFEMTPSDWQRVVGVDLTGVFYCTQVIGAVMREHGGGSVVNIASVAATVSFPDRTAYVAAKAGVIGLTRSTAQSLAPHNIRVNAVSPGPIDTPLYHTNNDGQGKDMMIERSPLRKLGTPTDIAEAVAFLLSDEANYITASVLTVDGGFMSVA